MENIVIPRRCTAHTLKGTRCKNKTDGESHLCTTHLIQQNYVFDPILNEKARAEMKAYNKRRRTWEKKHRGRYYPESLPESIRDLVCGARTRAGTPCKRKDWYFNGRCKLHGGLSTGPRTEEGKRRASQNWRGRKKAFAEQHRHNHGVPGDTARTLADIIKGARRKEIKHG